MWLNDVFSKLLRKKHSAVTALQSDVTALHSAATSMQSAATSDNLKKQQESTQESNYSAVTALQSDDIKLEKDSLHLGLAAGYTGRSIHDINSTLNRIESLMVTKDWFTINDRSQQLYELLTAIKLLLESHDKKTFDKFESIERSLERISNISEYAPEPIKSQLTKEIKTIESELPLSPKMKETLKIVLETGEISYKDLTIKLGYKDVSSLRSLLSHMVERTNRIEKFEKHGEKFLRVKAL